MNAMFAALKKVNLVKEESEGISLDTSRTINMMEFKEMSVDSNDISKFNSFNPTSCSVIKKPRSSSIDNLEFNHKFDILPTYFRIRSSELFSHLRYTFETSGVIASSGYSFVPVKVFNELFEKYKDSFGLSVGVISNTIDKKREYLDIKLHSSLLGI